MKRLQLLKDLNENDSKNLIDSIDYVFFDMDGVLLLYGKPVPGSEKCVKKLKELGKTVGVVTNNSHYPTEYIANNFFTELTVADLSLSSPIDIFLDYLKEINFNKDIFCICSKYFKHKLKNAGYKILTYEDICQHSEYVESYYLDVREKISNICKNVGFILLGTDFSFCHLAAQIVLNIISENKDVLLASSDYEDILFISDLNVVCSAYYIDAFQRWANKKCIKMGKPGSVMAKHLIAKYGITDPSRVLFVGDSIPADIAFGVKHNFKTLLVLSGTTSKNDIEHWKFPQWLKPHYIADSVNDLLEKLN